MRTARAAPQRGLLPIALALALAAPAPAAPVLVNNTAPRTTADGATVDSHNGGTVVAFGGRYYLYGIAFGGCVEQREGCSNSSVGACGFGQNTSVSVYSSLTLAQDSWVLERADVLPVPAGPRRGSVSRPNLVRHPQTGDWLLFWNFANTTDSTGQWALAVARSASPLGPFELVAAPIAMPHDFIGDFTIFVDVADDTAWVYYTNWMPATLGQLFLARLDAAFTGLAEPREVLGPLFGLDLMESPQVWFREGGGGGDDAYYFLAGHGCCFCAEGSGLFVFTAPSVRGMFTPRGNVGCNYSQPAAHVSVASHGCLLDGACYTSTLQAEFAYAFEAGAQRVLVFDRWQHAPDGLKAHDPEYWLPVEYAPSGGLLPLRRTDAWTLDAPTPPAP
jgi:hypothetical protein